MQQPLEVLSQSQTAGQATSQDRATHPEDIYPLPNTNALCRSPPTQNAWPILLPWLLGHGWFWHHWDMNTRLPDDTASDFQDYLRALIFEVYQTSPHTVIALQIISKFGIENQTNTGLLLDMIRHFLIQSSDIFVLYIMRIYYIQKSVCLSEISCLY